MTYFSSVIEYTHTRAISYFSALVVRVGQDSILTYKTIKTRQRA